MINDERLQNDSCLKQENQQVKIDFIINIHYFLYFFFLCCSKLYGEHMLQFIFIEKL